MKSIVWLALSILLLSNSVANAAPTATSPKNDLENKKKMARTWYEEVIVKENLKPFDDIMAADVTMDMDPSYPSKATGTTHLTGLDQVKKHVQTYTGAATTSGKVLDLVGEGDTVMLFRLVSMKLPNGSATNVPWVTIFHFNKAGKISHIRHVHDTAYEASQLKK